MHKFTLHYSTCQACFPLRKIYTPLCPPPIILYVEYSVRTLLYSTLLYSTLLYSTLLSSPLHALPTYILYIHACMYIVWR